jgi:hypothetical protein
MRTKEDALPNENDQNNINITLPPTITTSTTSTNTTRPQLQYGRYNSNSTTHSHYIGGWDNTTTRPSNYNQSRPSPYPPQSSYRQPYPPQHSAHRSSISTSNQFQRPPPTNSTFNSSPSASSTPVPARIVYASNLPLGTAQSEVRSALATCGSMFVQSPESFCRDQLLNFLSIFP